MTPREPAGRSSGWFQLVAASSAVFILTVFIMLASAFNGRPASVKRFFNDHGSLLLAVEVGVILSLAFAAMAADRRATARQLRARHEALLNGRTDGSGDAAACQPASATDLRPDRTADPGA